MFETPLKLRLFSHQTLNSDQGKSGASNHLKIYTVNPSTCIFMRTKIWQKKSGFENKAGENQQIEQVKDCIHVLCYYQLFCWEINRYEKQILHLLPKNLNEPVLLHFHDHKKQLTTGFGKKSENPLNFINFKSTFRDWLSPA